MYFTLGDEIRFNLDNECTIILTFAFFFDHGLVVHHCLNFELSSLSHTASLYVYQIQCLNLNNTSKVIYIYIGMAIPLVTHYYAGIFMLGDFIDIVHCLIVLNENSTSTKRANNNCLNVIYKLIYSPL